MLPDAGAIAGMGFPRPVKQKARQLSPKVFSRYSVFSKTRSWCIFLRHEAMKEVGSFDENMGIGAPTPWQSGEETDYLLRVMAAGHMVYRAPSIHVFHDAQDLRRLDLPKIRGYSFGRMYLLHKHNFPYWFTGVNIIYPLAHMAHECIRLGPWAIKNRLAMFSGRLKGFFAARKAVR
jgi:GT2 family glycosyltransferase